MFTMVSFVFYKGSGVKKKKQIQKASFTGGVGSCLTPGKDRSVTLKRGEGGPASGHLVNVPRVKEMCTGPVERGRETPPPPILLDPAFQGTETP